MPKQVKFPQKSCTSMVDPAQGKYHVWSLIADIGQHVLNILHVSFNPSKPLAESPTPELLN